MSLMRQLRVIDKWQEAEGVYGFELGDLQGAALPPFTPGAHVDVRVPGGPLRQYSLSRPYSAGRGYEIAVLHEPQSRGGSAGMCTRVEVGALLEVATPRNQFELEGAERTLLLAGGIGITPLLCMAEHLAATRGSFELHYCARSVGRMAFRQRVAAPELAPRTFLYFDDEDGAQRLELSRVLGAPAEGKRLYVCGPGGFLQFVRSATTALGWPDRRIHFEYFAPPQETVTTRDTAFEVVIASSGQSIPVASGESIVTALTRAGIDIPVSCEQGVCGSCLTRVLEGEPDHRDYFLSNDEREANTHLTPCCSRAKGARLVLGI